MVTVRSRPGNVLAAPGTFTTSRWICAPTPSGGKPKPFTVFETVAPSGIVSDGNNGPVIVLVQSGGPAAVAGLAVGDLVVSIDGIPTPDSATLIDTVASHKPGDVVKLKVTHQDGTSATVSVTLGQLPS